MKASTPSNLVANVVFCDKDSQIIRFIKLPAPAPKKEINLNQLFDKPYDSALLTFTDGRAKTIKPNA